MQRNHPLITAKDNQALSKRLEITHITILMFCGIIGAGTILLMSPLSQKEPVSFIDALFTAASATCVTGLLTVNVAESFTAFGQVVIMALIELGAIGIITVSAAFVMMLGKSISITQSSVIHGTFTASNRIDIRKLIKAVLFFLLAFEALGAIIFTLLWLPEMGLKRAAFHGVFHSISAFCNAGISTFTDGLAGFEKDIPTSAVFLFLFVAGGIGFLSIAEIYDRLNQTMLNRKGPKQKRTKWTFQIKLVFVYTFASIAIVSALVLILEFHGAHAGKPFAEQLMSSVFHTASSRTAGFSTISSSHFSSATLYLFMLLMFVGGAPVSTAGGIKVTTFALLVGMAVSRARGSQAVQIMKRSVPEKVMSRAISIVFIAIVVLTISMFVLLITESQSAAVSSEKSSEFMPILFEAVSAFGTVGLSMGVTPHLSLTGKLVIALLMIMGRLGPLTIAMVIATGRKGVRHQYAEETVMVG